MKLKFFVINSLYDKMFAVEVDDIYVNLIAAKSTFEPEYKTVDGKLVESGKFRAMKYDDFMQFAKDLHI